MPPNKGHRKYVLELSLGLEGVSYRKTTGKYILCYRSEVVGGIYGNRPLFKVTPTSERLLPDTPRAIPYEGVEGMFPAEVEDREALCDVVDAMREEVSASKRSKK